MGTELPVPIMALKGSYPARSGHRGVVASDSAYVRDWPEADRQLLSV
jgi:hypothetical protein